MDNASFDYNVAIIKSKNEIIQMYCAMAVIEIKDMYCYYYIHEHPRGYKLYACNNVFRK